MKRKSKLIKIAKRLWERIKSGKLLILLSCLVVLIVLMMVLVLKQRDIGAREAGLQIESLANTVRSYYQSRPDYWGLSTAEVIKNKIYPAEMAVSDGKLLGYFGNPVEVGMDTIGSPVMPTIKNFVITYSKLTKEQCTALASDRFRKVFWLGIKDIIISNDISVYSFGWDNKESILPIDKKKASELCSNGSSVSFRFE